MLVNLVIDIIILYCGFFGLEDINLENIELRVRVWRSKISLVCLKCRM